MSRTLHSFIFVIQRNRFGAGVYIGISSINCMALKLKARQWKIEELRMIEHTHFA